MDDFFFSYMQGLLGERFDDFMSAYREKPRHKALRVNTLKISVEDLNALKPGLRGNPLCAQSFYSDEKPSLDPLYHAGLYYMQEPSASAAVAAFAPFIGERVLDLCAAPGGKTTQAAAFMHGGVLFCNDAEFKRTRALAENIERLGISDTVVTCNTAADYRAAGFDGYFDTLIADVPCSGGGMMRYEKVPFSAEIVAGCAKRQRTILSDAAALVCGGGYMLYSTCTFTKEENEDNINYLTSLGFETVDIPLSVGTERGIGFEDSRRVYPMNFDGEGHFYCVLQKHGGASRDRPPIRKKRGVAKFNNLKIDTAKIAGRTVIDGEFPDVSGLNVVRLGTQVFDESKLPSHAFAHALSAEQVKMFGSAEVDMNAAVDYIRGKQLDMQCSAGLKIVTVNGHALGLAKSAPSGDGFSSLKNKYPKSLRVQA